MSTNTATTRILVRRCQAGDRAAFEQLFRMHHEQVKQWVNNHLRGESVLIKEDACQETWECAWKGIKGFRMESRFSTWLYKVCENAAHQVRRREQRHVPATLNPDDDDERYASFHGPASSADLPSWHMEVMDFIQVLMEAMKQLTPDQFAIFSLNCWGAKNVDTARMLGKESNNVAAHLNHARKGVASFLDQSYPEYRQDLHDYTIQALRGFTEYFLEQHYQVVKEHDSLDSMTKHQILTYLDGL